MSYPVEWVYAIIVVALILAAVTWYLYTHPGEKEEILARRQTKKKKKARKATRKR